MSSSASDVFAGADGAAGSEGLAGGGEVRGDEAAASGLGGQGSLLAASGAGLIGSGGVTLSGDVLAGATADVAQMMGHSSHKGTF